MLWSDPEHPLDPDASEYPFVCGASSLRCGDG